MMSKKTMLFVKYNVLCATGVIPAREKVRSVTIQLMKFSASEYATFTGKTTEIYEIHFQKTKEKTK